MVFLLLLLLWCCCCCCCFYCCFCVLFSSLLGQQEHQKQLALLERLEKQKLELDQQKRDFERQQQRQQQTALLVVYPIHTHFHRRTVVGFKAQTSSTKEGWSCCCELVGRPPSFLALVHFYSKTRATAFGGSQHPLAHAAFHPLTYPPTNPTAHQPVHPHGLIRALDR